MAKKIKTSAVMPTVYVSRNQFGYRKGTLIVNPQKKQVEYYHSMTNSSSGKTISHKKMKQMLETYGAMGVKIVDNRKSK